MVASKESFSSLQLTDGPSIHMGDDTQIQAEGKGSINLEHQECSLCALLSNNFVFFILDDSYRLTKASGIWS